MFGHFNKSLYIFPVFLAKNKDIEAGDLRVLHSEGLFSLQGKINKKKLRDAV